MPAREALLDIEAKRELASHAFEVTAENADSGWEDAPEGATGIVRGIEWESQFGDLDMFRRYVGKYRVVLPAVTMQKVVNVLDGNGMPVLDANGNPTTRTTDEYDDKATKSVATSIKTRLSKVYPSESWSTSGKSDGIRLSYQGTRTVRSTSGNVVSIAS